jgi:hypothetical protein
VQLSERGRTAPREQEIPALRREDLCAGQGCSHRATRAGLELRQPSSNQENPRSRVPGSAAWWERDVLGIPSAESYEQGRERSRRFYWRPLSASGSCAQPAQ